LVIGDQSFTRNINCSQDLSLSGLNVENQSNEIIERNLNANSTGQGGFGLEDKKGNPMPTNHFLSIYYNDKNLVTNNLGAPKSINRRHLKRESFNGVGNNNAT
jgi:hypothetical protein